MLNQEHLDTDAFLKGWADDAVWDGPSDLGIGETIRGKAAIADWYKRWDQEFPKRTFVAGTVCTNGAYLPNRDNVMTCEWTCTETDRHGRDFVVDGVAVFRSRNMKVVGATDYISLVGLPQLSTLLKPTGDV